MLSGAPLRLEPERDLYLCICASVDVAVAVGSEISFRVAPAHSWLSTVDVCGFVRTQCLRSFAVRFDLIVDVDFFHLFADIHTDRDTDTATDTVANMWSGNNRKSKQQKLEQTHSENTKEIRIAKEVNKNVKF